MIEIGIEKLKRGDILGRSIEINGTTLIEDGMIITDAIINKLQRYGISSVVIHGNNDCENLPSEEFKGFSYTYKCVINELKKIMTFQKMAF